jgi:hypothetical protein
MSLFANIKKKVGASSQKLWREIIDSYLAFNPKNQQLTLKAKAVTLLCHQVEAKVEQISSLQPSETEGLVATIEHNNSKIELHFTPESITFTKDYIEGQLHILEQPLIHSDDWLYKSLIGGWKVFLGGTIPNFALPEKLRIDGDKVYYKFPREDIKLLKALCDRIEENSTLTTHLHHGELMIEGAITFNWREIDLQGIIQILTPLAKTIN